MNLYLHSLATSYDKTAVLAIGGIIPLGFFLWMVIDSQKRRHQITI